ncbi:patatin-like phospholipase domain-containing protein [Hydrogenimonas cancrithermarum]|uniref:PNPLA domain-containing protein n=1 Tax=Hydrogenimonas cancrithermarum TaxID=2993563 RepID=A0ABM8FNB3_9BACT|nr:patatin-like phospholipase family protein [Hydrogenimonas cancrithermarum]BDY13878.1 hypothetical protein HCR_21900 [Hydrogenimonas cancrithermarum]
MRDETRFMKEDISNGLFVIFESYSETAKMDGLHEICTGFLDDFHWNDPEAFRSGAFRILDETRRKLKSETSMKPETMDDVLEEIHDLLFKKVYYRFILDRESEWIEKRRELADDHERDDPSHDAFGLALSGGGIRSATFNLGLLQTLQRYDIFKSVDYLSTVSGGGYIGSSQTWLKYVKPELEYPFGAKRKDHDGMGGKILSWLRDHGNYLNPGHGLNLWSLIGAFMGSVLINVLILVPIFLLAVYLLYITSPYHVFAYVGALLLLVYVAKIALYALDTVRDERPNFYQQRLQRKRAGNFLMSAVLMLAVGSIPWLHDFLNMHLKDWIDTVSLSTLGAGLASFITAYSKSKTEESQPKGAMSFLLSAGVGLMLYGALIWAYHLFWLSSVGTGLLLPLSVSLSFSGLIFIMPKIFKNSIKTACAASVILLAVSIGVSTGFLLDGTVASFGIGMLLLLLLPISALFAAYTKINYVSMHRFYRNRLMEAYFPWNVVDVEVEKADKFYLKDMKPAKTPYHIINTNVNMVGSKRTRQRERGGDNFILSPLFCGSDVTGYRPTDRYASGGMNLATAFAISGAAVDPNTYATRSKPISFVMSLLNARLGYWIENPRKIDGVERIGWSYYISIFKELFGSGLNENETYIHLADGGHFENLGVYELIRRKCRYIIVSDAGKDPDFTFGDLAKAIELARVDFGAQITIDTEPLRPLGEEKISDTAFVYGTITYNDGKVGDLIYVKTTIVEGLPEDIYSYRRTNPNFPDQTTTDQFFDEMQFEAYRELGYQIGKRLCKGREQEDFTSIFRH